LLTGSPPLKRHLSSRQTPRPNQVIDLNYFYVLGAAVLIAALAGALRLSRHLRAVKFLAHFTAGGFAVFNGFVLGGIRGLLHGDLQ